jgi:hypothetical protein
MRVVVDIDDNLYTRLFDNGVEDYELTKNDLSIMAKAIRKGTFITSSVLADMLMEERIRGKLDFDTTFEKDIIDDVKCRLTVSIRDHRPCYCGAELKEVWRESEE